MSSTPMTTTRRSGRSTKPMQLFVPGSKSSKGECWGLANQPGSNISAATATATATSSAEKKEMEELGTDIYYDILKYHYGWKHSGNTSLSEPTWNLFNPQVPSKERAENISKFTGYQAVATRYKQDGENLDAFLIRCGHDPSQMLPVMDRNIENKKKRKQRPSSATMTASGAVDVDDDHDDDDESTMAMEDDSSSLNGDNKNNETSNLAPTRLVRRDPPAARVSPSSPSSSLESAAGRKYHPRTSSPPGGETIMLEERVQNMGKSLKTAMDRIHELEKTVKDLKPCQEY
jgi:hypothetical protein